MRPEGRDSWRTILERAKVLFFLVCLCGFFGQSRRAFSKATKSPEKKKRRIAIAIHAGIAIGDFRLQTLDERPRGVTDTRKKLVERETRIFFGFFG
jgi:hypothetical protein